MAAATLENRLKIVSFDFHLKIGAFLILAGIFNARMSDFLKVW